MAKKKEILALLADNERMNTITLEELEDNLSNLQVSFCKQYIIHFNGARAAKEAGYNTVNYNRQAFECLRNPIIKKYIELSQKKLADHFQISQERLIRELSNIAFFNLADLFDDDGKLLAPTRIPRHASAAITEIKERVVQKLDGGETVIDRQYKISRREQALDMLMKHLGLYAKDNEQRQVFAQMIFNLPHNGRNTELLEKYKQLIELAPNEKPKQLTPPDAKKES